MVPRLLVGARCYLWRFVRAQLGNLLNNEKVLEVRDVSVKLGEISRAFKTFIRQRSEYCGVINGLTMGLLTVLKKLKQKEKEMRILMLGLDNAGKTTVLKRLNGEPIDTISPTLGFNIKTLEHRGYKLNVWDVGGQKSLRSYWRNYFESTDGLVWVIDSADRRRLDDCKTELYKLLQEERLEGASLLVFANKQDMPGALSAADIADILELPNIKTHHWQIYKCSAVTGENLVDGINWIVDDIAARIFYID